MTREFNSFIESAYLDIYYFFTGRDIAGIRSDLRALRPLGKMPPDPAPIRQLANDLKGIGGAPIPTATRSVVHSDLTAVLRSTGVKDTALINKTAADMIKLIETPGVTPRRVLAFVRKELVLAIALDKLPPPKDHGNSGSTS